MKKNYYIKSANLNTFFVFLFSLAILSVASSRERRIVFGNTYALAYIGTGMDNPSINKISDWVIQNGYHPINTHEFDVRFGLEADILRRHPRWLTGLDVDIAPPLPNHVYQDMRPVYSSFHIGIPIGYRFNYNANNILCVSTAFDFTNNSIDFHQKILHNTGEAAEEWKLVADQYDFTIHPNVKFIHSFGRNRLDERKIKVENDPVNDVSLKRCITFELGIFYDLFSTKWNTYTEGTGKNPKTLDYNFPSAIPKPNPLSFPYFAISYGITGWMRHTAPSKPKETQETR